MSASARSQARWLSTLAATVALANPVARGNETVPLPSPSERVRIASLPKPVRSFDLLDHESHAFTERDLLGRTSLVYFGFTNCRTVCSPTMTQLRGAVRELDVSRAQLAAILVSVDGERDTPAALSKFLEPFGPQFIGLTGEARALRDVATDFAAVAFRGMPIDTSGGYDVEHTSQVYLVDRRGRLRATFYNAPVEEIVDTTHRVIREE